ncbi:helix-turn-helix domain-containing protein [Peribacillus simplex]|uniref:Helix-turn-helix domain-containing protein n=1 Tax=Peribacillus simplex TaxID=1478 RepID=A0AAW7ILL5_9BACI|nr:helix-turn-helix domain-containing protein [Peribacillus simplex]MDM5455234.1 helix-turn-helix domain-containing protein [Peribacillus simplex]
MVASTKRRKKRMKRQLKKRFKQASGTVLVVETKEPQQFMAHILYKGKYKVENQAYQAQLDAVYGGKVQPIERHINQTAIILHHYSECDQRFYARPKWLLSKEGQRHDCYCYLSSMPTGVTKKSQRIVSDEDILKMCTLFSEGISTTKIAIELGVSRPTVNKYLKQAGVK